MAYIMYKIHLMQNNKTIEIEFIIIRKIRLKHKYIEINKNGIFVKVNKSTSIKDIKEMMIKKSKWILKKIELFKERKYNKIENDSKLYYLGKKYQIQIVSGNYKKIIIDLKDSIFYIFTPLTYTKIEMENSIKSFYKQNAIQQILPIVENWSKVMKVTPTKVSFRYAKKRWGSCSNKNRISLNFNLMKLPLSLIEYVVVHELAHIKHHNHSKDFWQFIEKYMNDYKFREKDIRDYEKLF